VAKFKKCNKYNFIAAFFGGFALLLFVAQLHLQEQRRRGRIFAALAQLVPCIFSFIFSLFIFFFYHLSVLLVVSSVLVSGLYSSLLVFCHFNFCCFPSLAVAAVDNFVL